MSYGLIPSQFILLPIFSLRRGLIKELGGSDERGERFTSEPKR